MLKLSLTLLMFLVMSMLNIGFAANKPKTINKQEIKNINLYIVEKEAEQAEMSESCLPPCIKAPNGECFLEGADGPESCAFFPHE